MVTQIPTLLTLPELRTLPDLMTFTILITDNVTRTGNDVLFIAHFKFIIWVQLKIFPAGPSDAGVQISGQGIVADFIRSIFDSLTIPLTPRTPSPATCLPNPYPPDLQRYLQIGKLNKCES